MDAVRSISITGSGAGAARPHSPHPQQGTVMIERVIEGEVIDRRRTNPGFDSAFDWTAWQRAASGSTTPLDTAAALAAYLSAASVIRGPASTGIDLYA